MSKTILYALAFIALGILTGSLGPTLPALAAHTQTTTSQISWLFIARSLGMISGGLLLGKLYDRWPGHPLLGGALLTAAGLFALLPSARWLSALVVLFVLVGLTLSLLNVGGNTLIVRVHGARVGPYMSLIHFAYGLGGLLTPLLARPFAGWPDTVKWTYLTLAIVILPAGLALFTLASPPLQHHTEHAAPDAKLTRPLALLLLFLFTEVGAEGAISGWIFTYARTQLANEDLAFYINSGFWAAFTLGRLLGIPLAWRWSEQRIIAGQLVGWLALTALALWLPNPTHAAWLLSVGSGFGMAPIFPMTLAWTQRTLHLSGQIAGWILVVSSLGSMLLPWLVGQLFERVGAQVLPGIVLGDLCLALVLLTSLLLQRRAAAQPLTAKIAA